MKLSTIVLVAASFFVTSTSIAQEVEAPKVASIANEASIQEVIAPVCAAYREQLLVLSEKAIKACEGDETMLPAFIKDGTRFSLRKTGAEFTVLLNNISYIVKQ